MLKGLIFDLDGTILDTIGDLADACNRTLGEFGFPLHTEAEYLAMIGKGAKQLIRDAQPQGASDEIWLRAYTFYDEWYRKNNMNKTSPFKGIQEVLDFANQHGLLMSVLSNKPQSSTEPLVKHFFGDAFDFIVGKRDEFPTKPDPTSALWLLKMMGIEKSQLLYIGDMDIDISTARAAGFTSIGVTWGFGSEMSLRESGADHIAHTPSELKDIIERFLYIKA